MSQGDHWTAAETYVTGVSFVSKLVHSQQFECLFVISTGGVWTDNQQSPLPGFQSCHSG